MEILFFNLFFGARNIFNSSFIIEILITFCGPKVRVQFAWWRILSRRIVLVIITIFVLILKSILRSFNIRSLIIVTILTCTRITANLRIVSIFLPPFPTLINTLAILFLIWIYILFLILVVIKIVIVFIFVTLIFVWILAVIVSITRYTALTKNTFLRFWIILTCSSCETRSL